MATTQAGYFAGSQVALTKGATNPGAAPALAVALTDGEGNILDPTGSDGVQLVSVGGSATVPIAAGATGNTVVKASAGRLCRVLITTAGTATSVAIYDNATTASGTIIGEFSGSAALGSVFDFQMPAQNGITVAGNTLSPAMTISYV